MLATRIPDRKFDFSLDYRVINELGAVLYARWLELPVTSPERKEYLRKAIAAYRRTLAIDSEDVGAITGLAQAYSDPAWGRPDGWSGRGLSHRRRPKPSPSIPTRSASWRPRSPTPSCTRIRAPVNEPWSWHAIVTRFMEGPRPRYQSRLEPLHDMVSDPRPGLGAGRVRSATLQAALAKP